MGSRFVESCASGVRALWRAGVDFLYPRACPLCGRADRLLVEASGIASVLCSPCRQNAAPVIEHSCQRCAAPVGPHLDTSGGCIHCRRDRFRFAGVFRAGIYDGLMRQACLQAKQPGGGPLGAALAMLLWEREKERLRENRFDLVVPVPRHWTRRFFRGHNAAETIGSVIARCLQAEFSRHILAKVRKTPPQRQLPSARRRANLRGAFRVRGKSPLQGATVLLADDILTTGTTANEASRVLKQAGAERVFVAVVARGIGRP